MKNWVRKLRNIQRNIAGLTLIEILIAMVIFAMILLAITGFMAMIAENNAYNHNFLVSSLIGQAKMEEMQNVPYRSAALVGTWGGYTPNSSIGFTPSGWQMISATGLVNPGGPYRLQWRIANDQPSFGFKTVEVRTRWVDGKLKNHTLNFIGVKALLLDDIS